MQLHDLTFPAAYSRLFLPCVAIWVVLVGQGMTKSRGKREISIPLEPNK